MNDFPQLNLNCIKVLLKIQVQVLGQPFGSFVSIGNTLFQFQSVKSTSSNASVWWRNIQSLSPE